MSKDFFLVINPTSNSGRAKKKIPRIISLFQEQKLSFDYQVTKQPFEATELAAKAAKEGWQTVVAVGGDGTICEVISGLLRNSGQKAKTKFGVLHIGTSPDFNRYHGIPTDLAQAVQVLAKGKSKIIDIGRVEYVDFNKQKKISYFGSNVNIGLGPQIANKANARNRTYLGDFLGTLLAVFQSLAGFRPFDLRVNIDGQYKLFANLLNFTVGKDPYLASGMKVSLPISADDGRLFILSIAKKSLLSTLVNLPKLYAGNILEYEAARVSYAKKVIIEAPGPNSLVEFDGDTNGYLPATVEVLPRALEVIVA
ncbi:MAG: YegS/Rv2252/BmrU family lipid kinase [bacterium]